MPIVILDAGVPYRVPVLNDSYPLDKSLIVIEDATGSAEFSVVIEKAGHPEEYSYQWYVDGNTVAGATQSAYTMTGLTEGRHELYCTVSNTAGTVSTRKAVVEITQHIRPVLDAGYPRNVTQLEAADGEASFEVMIASDGIPAEHTYQWYENGAAVNGANASVYRRMGLTEQGTYNIFCRVTNAAGYVDSRTAVLNVQDTKPTFDYTGTVQTVEDGPYNHRIKFLTSGKLTFTHLGCFAGGIDVFLVGGGGGGCGAGSLVAGGGGGGGGYTETGHAQVELNTPYDIFVGAGGAGGGLDWHEAADGVYYSWAARGGTSSAFGLSADGGWGGASNPGTWQDTNPFYVGGNGGSGGGGGCTGPDETKAGPGGSDGGNGGGDCFGYGQGTTTREFGESNAQLYAGGGAGAAYGEGWDRVYSYAGGDGGGGNSSASGKANTGGGGGGSNDYPGSGGSGIVVIRNRR